MAPGSLLSSLPTRPPTPPKDFASSDPILPSAEVKALTTLLDTPETPSNSIPDYFSSKSPHRGTKRKRVNFNLTLTHHQSELSSSPPSLPQLSPHHLDRLPLLPRQPSAVSKPHKSILKASRYGLSSDLSLDSDDLPRLSLRNISIGISEGIKMIVETVKNILNQDKSTRLQAYQTLLDAVKTKPDVASSNELKSHLPRISASLRNDLSCAFGSDHRDGQLAVEALKIITTLSHRDVLPDAYLASVLDWCIQALGQANCSKVLANNILLFIKMTKSVKLFTTTRVVDLFDRLKEIDKRVKGKQTQILRFDIYKKLILQNHSYVFQKSKVWLRQLLDNLVSDKTETVQQTIQFGRAVAISHGDRKEISKALVGLLQDHAPSSEPEGGDANNGGTPITKSYFSYIASRLLQFVAKRKHAERAPQVWSIVMLLLRHKTAHHLKWENWGNWLTILQRCFNSSDADIRNLANEAWRDYIWASQDEILKDENLRKNLFRPVLGQLERREKDKSRPEVELTFCALVYYILRPGANSGAMTTAWNDFIVQALKLSSESRQQDRQFAAEVLHSLLGGNEQKIWDKDRVFQPQRLDSSCLLHLDPQWIRTNVDSVLKILDPLLTFSEPRDLESQDVNVYQQTWRQLVAAIANCCRREVRPSSATLKALAKILSFVFRRTLVRYQPEQSYRLATSLLEAVLDFTSLPVHCNSFVRNGANVVCIELNGSQAEEGYDEPCPVTALELITDFLAPSCTSSWSMAISPNAFSRAVTLGLETMASRQNRLMKLSSWSRLCSCTVDASNASEATQHRCKKGAIWRALAISFAHTLQYTSYESLGSQQSGQDFFEGVHLLAAGAPSNVYSRHEWNALLRILAHECIEVAGPGGLLLGLLIPLLSELGDALETDVSGSIKEEQVEMSIEIAALIPPFPREEELHCAEKKLWGAFRARLQETGHPIESILTFLTLLMLSNDQRALFAAAEAWNRLQTNFTQLNVPEDLYLALLRASKVTNINMENIANEGVDQGSSDVTDLGLHAALIGPQSPDYKSKKDTESSLPCESEQGYENLSSIPSQKFVKGGSDTLSPSPRNVHLEQISPRGFRNEISDKEPEEEVPLPLLPIPDAFEKNDSSPTPARQLSQPQSELADIDIFFSSPLKAVPRFEIRSDPVEIPRHADSSAADSRRHKARKSSRGKRMRHKRQAAATFQLGEDRVVDATQRQHDTQQRLPGDQTSVVKQPEPSRHEEVINVETYQVSPRRLRRAKSEREVFQVETNNLRHQLASNTDASSLTTDDQNFPTPRAAKTQSRYFRHDTFKSFPEPARRRGSDRARSSSKSQRDVYVVSETRDDDIQDCIIISSNLAPKNGKQGRIPNSAPEASPTLTPDKDTSNTLTTTMNESHTAPYGSTPLEPSELSFPTSIKRKRTASESDETEELIETGETETPLSSKRQKLADGASQTTQSVVNSSSATFSATALEILGRLSGLLGDVRRAVLGRGEAREIYRTLNRLTSATVDAEERAEEQE